MSTTATAVRNGFVYVLRRPDLNKCYVGQSVHTGRPYKHVKPGCYQYDELCVDNVEPIIEIVEERVPEGTELDETERDWMRAMVEEGWTLINRLGPDDTFPKMSFELCSKGGKLGGKIGGSVTSARRSADPVFDAHWREVAAKAGNAALRLKRSSDPQFDETCRDAEARGGRAGSKVRALRRATDPAWAAQEKLNASLGGLRGGRNGGLKTSSIQRVCADCGLGPTTPGGMGIHLRRTNHSGYLDVALPTVTKE